MKQTLLVFTALFICCNLYAPTLATGVASFNTPTISNGNIILTGTAIPAVDWYLKESPDLNTWDVAPNQPVFIGNNFACTNSINTNAPQMYYLLVQIRNGGGN